MRVKLRRRRAVAADAPQNDITSILAALEATSPEDAAAAKQVAGSDSGGVGGARKRAVQGNDNDVNAILAALEANSPEDAEAAKGL